MVKNHDPMTNRTRGLIPLPAGDVPSTTQCILICIPSGEQYKRQLMGGLYEFTHWNGYERDDTHKATLVAQAWRNAIMEGMLNCYQFKTIDGLLAFSNDGGATWTPVPAVNDGSSDYDPRTDSPIKPARTGDNIPCLAAANATACFKELHRELSVWYSEAGIILSFLYSIGAILQSFFDTVWAIFGLHVDIIDLATDILAHQAALNVESWTEGIERSLMCILYANADVNGQWDATAYNAILAEIATKDGNMWALIGHYISGVSGIVGLNNAGTTNSVTTAVCEPDCGQWCYEFNFATGQQSFTITSSPRGVYSAGNGFAATYYTGPNERVWIDRDFGAIDITKAQIDFTTDAPGAIQWYVDGVLQDTDNIGNGDTMREFAGERTLGVLSIRYDATNRSNTLLRKLRLYGWGENPFGESNCS